MSDKLNYIYDSEIFIDLYEILELNIECTSDEIKSSYIRLAKKHHPDQGGNSDLFQEVTRAYEILYNEAGRKEYDLYYLKKSTDEYKVDDAIKFKNEFLNFINTNKKIISEEKLDELYNDVFKDKIEYKEVKLESEDLKKRINDINLERKNIDIDTLDDRLYNLVNENKDEYQINELFEFIKNKNNIEDNKIILSDLQTVDTITNNLTYSSLIDNEYISSKLYTDISYEDDIIIKDGIDSFDINEFNNWKKNKKNDNKLSIKEIDNFLEKRKIEENEILEEVSTNLKTTTRVKDLKKFLKITNLSEDDNIYNYMENIKIQELNNRDLIKKEEIQEKTNVRKREFK